MLVLTTAPSPALSTERDSVQDILEIAKDLINRQEYMEALVHLTDAYRIKPTAGILFNIAMCEKALNRHADAINSFYHFFDLETEAANVNNELHTLAQSAVDELLGLVATVRVTEVPDGADVFVDRRNIGTTPLADPLFLAPGNHTISVMKTGYAPIDIDLTAVGGASLSVRADLKSSLSLIIVKCSVQNGRVFIDGEYKGDCPYEGTIESGVHEVKIAAPQKQSAVHSIMAEARRTTMLSVDLLPLFPIAPAERLIPVQNKRIGIQAAGIGLTVLGTIGLSIGGICHYKWQSYVNDANDQKDRIVAAHETRDMTNDTDLDDMSELYDQHATYADNAVPWRDGAIAAYAAGGVLTAVGVGLLIYRLSTKKDEDEHAKVLVRPDGLGIYF